MRIIVVLLPSMTTASVETICRQNDDTASRVRIDSIAHRLLQRCASGSAAQCEFASLQRATNTAVRLVAGLGPCDRESESMKALHWLSMQDRTKFKQCVMMHSVANDPSPVCIKNLVTPTKQTYRRSHRQRRRETTKFKRLILNLAFSFVAPSEWNALPQYQLI